MAVSKGFGRYAVTFDSVVISQIQDFAVSTELNKLLHGSSKSVFNTYIAIANQQDSVRFTTSQLAVALAKVGIDGAAIKTGDLLECYFQQFASGGTFEAAGSTKMVVNEGLIVPRTISARDGDFARLSYEALAVFDGTNDPVAVTIDQTVATAAAASELFDVGPVKINGSAVEGIQSIDVDFGITLRILRGDGDGRPTFIAVRNIQPVITCVTTDIETLSTLKLLGTTQSATASKVYLRKYSKNLAGGITHLADVTAEHISFATPASTGHIHVSEANVSEDGEATATIIITAPSSDGVVDPITIATATAIT